TTPSGSAPGPPTPPRQPRAETPASNAAEPCADSVAGNTPTDALAARDRADRDGSRVHCDSLDEGGAQLCPCGIATATPQHFTMASRPTSTCPPRSSPPRHDGTGARRSRPLSARFEPASL